MIRLVLAAIDGWDYSVVSIGYPGPVKDNKPAAEPKNLGRGWVAFDFGEAFDRPVKVLNDATMQALGSYKHGRMLFLGTRHRARHDADHRWCRRADGAGASARTRTGGPTRSTSGRPDSERGGKKKVAQERCRRDQAFQERLSKPTTSSSVAETPSSSSVCRPAFEV